MHRFLFLITFLCIPAIGQVTSPEPIPYDSLQIVLEEIYDSDQGIRKKFVEAMQSGSSKTGELAGKMNRIDSVNQIHVREILQKYGWLGQSQVGSKAANALFYIVQHGELELIEQYYESLQALADIGEASAISAAMMLDRMLMYQGKKQVYGTQASNLVREERVSVIWPVKDPSNVNARRQQIGFRKTLEESAADMDAIYDPEEELPKRNVWK